MTTSNTPSLDAAWTAAIRRGMETYQAADVIGMLEAEITADLIDAQRALVRHAGRVARNMNRLAERLEADAGDAGFVNSLGEIQADGLSVDRLCGQIGTMRETLRRIAAARKAAER